MFLTIGALKNPFESSINNKEKLPTTCGSDDTKLVTWKCQVSKLEQAEIVYNSFFSTTIF